MSTRTTDTQNTLRSIAHLLSHVLYSRIFFPLTTKTVINEVDRK